MPGRTFRWSGRYSQDFNVAHHPRHPAQRLPDFRPKLPAAWRDSPYVFLANIDPELQLDVLSQVDRPRFVACDTMNYWIEGKREALERLLQKVDLLLLNDDEARLLARHGNLPAAARAIRALGPRAVVIKRGDAGALLFHEGGRVRGPRLPHRGRWSIPPARATPSRAASWAGWPAPAPPPPPTSAPP